MIDLTIDIDEIDSALMTRGYFFIQTAELTAAAEAARAEYLDLFRRLTTHAPAEKFTYSQLCELGSWKKIGIASKNGVGEPYAQCLLTTYFAPKLKLTPHLVNIFASIEDVRNKLMRVAPDFGANPARDMFWNAARMHHYPSGGGFMSGHYDTYFPMQLGDKPYYQICVLLSRKGQDFETGGGFVHSHTDKTKVDLETEAGFGTMVIFDGKTFHGVDEVDSHCVMNFEEKRGRLAAFSTTYKYNP